MYGQELWWDIIHKFGIYICVCACVWGWGDSRVLRKKWRNKGMDKFLKIHLPLKVHKFNLQKSGESISNGSFGLQVLADFPWLCPFRWCKRHWEGRAGPDVCGEFALFQSLVRLHTPGPSSELVSDTCKLQVRYTKSSKYGGKKSCLIMLKEQMWLAFWSGYTCSQEEPFWSKLPSRDWNWDANRYHFHLWPPEELDLLRM